MLQNVVMEWRLPVLRQESFVSGIRKPFTGRVTVICESQRNYDTLTKALLSHADKRNPLIRLTTKLSRDNFNSRKCQAGTMRSLVDHEIAVLR